MAAALVWAGLAHNGKGALQEEFMEEIFTIVSPDYEGAVTEYSRQRFIESLLRQSFPCWRLLLIHDGPRDAPIERVRDGRITYLSTERRANDWGHSQRDFGISLADGEFIWVINPDNYLQSHALAIAYAYSRHEKSTHQYKVASGEVQTYCNNPDVLICAIRMMGLVSMGHTGGHVRFRGRELQHQLLFPGWPPRKFGVDAMSMIARAGIYKSFGWPYRHEDSDGDVIESITSTHGYKLVPEILGEHW